MKVVNWCFKCIYNVFFVIFMILKKSDVKGSSSNFQYGDSNFKNKIVIYRLIGNDMPPLQQQGQLRWNTKFTIDNENIFHGVTKRWVLNRIYNDTDYTGIYGDLMKAGVNRRDIISNCFDLEIYKSYKNIEDKTFYLTAQNDGRNIAVLDGRNSGFEWSLVLDGNTFITHDSWMIIEKALKVASDKGMQYMKIPYHKINSEQSVSWLNKGTTLNSLLSHAPAKGESQIAFHKSSNEMFLLDDKQENETNPVKYRGYGQKNKSYLFKEGSLCGPDSKQCQCSTVVEGNEENTTLISSYIKDCGLILRLWSYPVDQNNASIQIAMENTDKALDGMIDRRYNSSKSLCLQVTSPSRTKEARHILAVFNADTLKKEAMAWRDKNSTGYKAIAPLVMNLIEKAESGLQVGPYSVLNKTRGIFNETDLRYYHSVRPYLWPFDLVPKELLKSLQGSSPECYTAIGMVHRDGIRVPGSIIGGQGEEMNDRASAWYFVANVTNLALAWHFTQDMKYANYATKLVDMYILSDETGLYINE